MRKQLIPCAAILVSVLLPLCARAQALAPQDRHERKSITVTGDAEIKVEPDEIVLTLGIETQDKDLARSKTLNDEVARKLLAALSSLGIDSEHIQTERLSIEPAYSSYRTAEDFIGYIVRKTFVVTITDVSRFDEVLSVSLASGVNNVEGIQYRATAMRSYKDQARSLAIRAAKEKAVALARDLGQEVGEPYSIVENGSDWYSWYGGSRWSSRAGGMSPNVSQNAGAGSTWGGDGEIEPGRISVTASVTVTFDLK